MRKEMGGFVTRLSEYVKILWKLQHVTALQGGNDHALPPESLYPWGIPALVVVVVT